MRTRFTMRNFSDPAEMTTFRCAMVFALIWVAFFALLLLLCPDDPPNVQGHLFDSSYVASPR